MMTKQFRSLAAALAAFILLTACANDSSQAQPDPSPAGDESSTDPAGQADYTILGGGQAMQGPGRWAVRAESDREAPLAVFDVPAGFQGRESFIWIDQGTARERFFGQVLYRVPNHVPADPCNAENPSPPLGPSVEDFANALVAQMRTSTTEPIPVELDGHQGLYLELTSPAKFDFSGCGEGEMLIFTNTNGDEGRVLDRPATDRYWILDLDGQRVVVTAMTDRDAADEDIELVTDVAKAATFVAPE